MVAFLTGMMAVQAVAQTAQEGGCGEVGHRVRMAVEQSPDKVLIFVEDAILANELCTCEIVKGAIVGSVGDRDQVRAIVFTAVFTSPGMAATIAECAIAVAPEAAEVITLALEEALVGVSGEGDASSYAGGKEVVYSPSGEEVVYSPSGEEVVYSPSGKEVVYSPSGKDVVVVSVPVPPVVTPSSYFSFVPVAVRKVIREDTSSSPVISSVTGG